MVLVTGGSRGIGRAICLAFAEEGKDVAFCYDKDEEGAKETARLISEKGAGAMPIRCDVSDERQVEEMFSALPALTILVNNAGIAHYGEISRTSFEDWNRIQAVNAGGVFLCTRAAVKKFVERGEGSIVNVSSIWGEVGASCEAAYSASKAAVIGFTKAAAKELGLSGIRVNCVSCGMIQTSMNGRLSEAEKSEWLKNIPIGREGTPEEVAAAVVFIAKQKYITGEVLRVNGGAVI